MKHSFYTLLVGFTLFALGAKAQIISTVAGNGTSGYLGDGGVATAAEFTAPGGVAVDGSGNIFIADQGNNVIRKVSPLGIITTVAGNGYGAGLGFGGYSGDGGVATAAELNSPKGLAIDGSGNLYITDRGNGVIRKINSSGIITTIAGGGGGGDGSPATAAYLGLPENVVVDASGNLFIAVGWGIKKVNTLGVISTIAGTLTLGSGYSGDGGPATMAQLDWAQGVAVDASGNVYIADFNNNRVRKVNTSAIITTIAGGAMSGLGDGGPATAAFLQWPTGVKIDGSGNLLIADWGNSRIRKVNTSGIITTIAGNGTGGFSGDGGVATAAELYAPIDIAIDGSGMLFIADNSNYRIRKVSSTNITITGTTTVCTGLTTSLSSATPGGAWSSGNTAVATISSTGVVTGISGGTAIISYIAGLSTGATTVTVYGSPSAGAITGMDSVCVGTTTTLSDWAPGEVWSSGGASAAVSAAGVVAGISAGTAIITYAVSNACSYKKALFMVRILPAGACSPSDVGALTKENNNITILPNPNHGTFTLQGSVNTQTRELSLNITNLLGEVVYSASVLAHNGIINTQIKLDNVANGLYLLHMRSETENIVARLVIGK